MNKEAKLIELINRYSQALLNDSWSGGGDPDDIPDIEEELVEARKALNEFITSLELDK